MTYIKGQTFFNWLTFSKILERLVYNITNWTLVTISRVLGYTGMTC